MIKPFVALFYAVILVSFPSFAQQSWKKVKEELLFDNAPFQQCHASSIVETQSGKKIAAWFGGSHEGSKDVCIWLSENKDGKWSIPVIVANSKVSDTLFVPLWNPVLFSDKRGRLFLFYKAGSSPRTWWGMVKTSEDEGQTWSEPRRLPDGILGPIKNKPVELKDGSILSPSSTETDKKWSVHLELSKDRGETWEVIPIDPESKFDVIQPSILFYPNHCLQLVCRSKQGNVIAAWSKDGGKTWGKLVPTALLNPNSGTDAVTLKDGRQLIVYNPSIPGKEWFNGRYKLNVALSKDGQKWTDILVLENGDTKKEFSYPAVIQSKDGKVHITYTYDRKSIKHVVLEGM